MSDTKTDDAFPDLAGTLMEKRCHAHTLANFIDRFLRDPQGVIPINVTRRLVSTRKSLRDWGDPMGKID